MFIDRIESIANTVEERLPMDLDHLDLDLDLDMDIGDDIDIM